MLTLVASGGLGNQLFQYAAARTHSQRLGVGLEIDTRFYTPENDGGPKGFWLDRLPIEARIKRYAPQGAFRAHGPILRAKRKLWDGLRRPIYREPRLAWDPEFRNIGDGTIVFGLFQSYRYFDPTEPPLLEELDLSILLPAGYRPPCHMQSRISLHVRRVDYVALGEAFALENPEHYYRTAMAIMRERYGDVRFLVFSDDPAWCRSSGLFNEDCDFFEDRNCPDGAQLYLMSLCAGHIISNSSYSLWAASVGHGAGKTVIAPKTWLFGLDARETEIVPPHWLTV